MIVIKLGGSVITDKSVEGCFRPKIMQNLAAQIKKAKKQIILVHGAGSFGHILAKEYRLNEGYHNEKQLIGFSKTQKLVQNLNCLVLDELIKNEIPAVGLSPHSILTLKDHKIKKIDYDIFDYYLKHGFLPVTYGDVALDEKLGFSICSGDLLVELLTRHFRPEKVVFVLDEDGIYSSNPKIDRQAKLIEKTTIAELEKLTVISDFHADVTGGMSAKINTIKNIAKIGIDTVLVNGNKPEVLYKVLIGEEPHCTTVYGDKKNE